MEGSVLPGWRRGGGNYELVDKKRQQQDGVVAEIITSSAPTGSGITRPRLLNKE
jgi:hypothetical protein